MSDSKEDWQVQVRSDGLFVVEGSACHPVCAVLGHEFKDGAKLVLSRAMLLSSAPDLLEALKDLLAISGYTYMSDDELRYEHEAGNEGIPPIIKARTAIAKAQGTQEPA